MAVEELGRRVERWVEAGVIGREQADAILALEGAAGREPGGGRRAVVVEVLGYLGGGLALVAGLAIGAESWDQLGYWGRVGVLAVVTAALLGAGWRLRGDAGRVLPRLAGVLWLAAVAAFAGLLAVVLGGRSGDAVDDPSLWVAGGSLVLAGGLYRLERRVPQQVALFVAGVATMVAAGHQFGWSLAMVEGGGLIVLGAVWLELGRRRLVEPRRTSEALGGLGLVIGSEALATMGPGAGKGFGQGGWGLWLGLGVAVALIVAGSALRRNVLLGLGTAAMVVFLAQIAGEYWRDLGAPLAILLVGLGLVVAAVLLARLRPSGTSAPR
ncbi:MAG TPA: DUF2157 domain-containing protein [Actinomycetota bacterium]|nr:DUF2157 domain-containing protein [Actinomycetota bacterium]